MKKAKLPLITCPTKQEKEPASATTEFDDREKLFFTTLRKDAILREGWYINLINNKRD